MSLSRLVLHVVKIKKITKVVKIDDNSAELVKIERFKKILKNVDLWKKSN